MLPHKILYLIFKKVYFSMTKGQQDEYFTNADIPSSSKTHHSLCHSLCVSPLVLHPLPLQTLEPAIAFTTEVSIMRKRIAPCTAACYGQLPGRLYLLDMCVTLLPFSLRTYLVYGGLLCLHPLSPFLFPHTCSRR